MDHHQGKNLKRNAYPQSVHNMQTFLNKSRTDNYDYNVLTNRCKIVQCNFIKTKLFDIRPPTCNYESQISNNFMGKKFLFMSFTLWQSFNFLRSISPQI